STSPHPRRTVRCPNRTDRPWRCPRPRSFGPATAECCPPSATRRSNASAPPGSPVRRAISASRHPPVRWHRRCPPACRRHPLPSTTTPRVDDGLFVAAEFECLVNRTHGVVDLRVPDQHRDADLGRVDDLDVHPGF